MGHSYKGAGCPPGNLTLWAAPVASPGAAHVVNWTTTSGNPYGWIISVSTSSGGPYTVNGFVLGSLRTAGGQPSGQFAVVQGIAPDSSPITKQSNEITVA
jgi:hypothetical protein